MSGHAITPTATKPYGETLSAFRSRTAQVDAHAISGDPEEASSEDAAPLSPDQEILIALALQLADEAARSDIECCCRMVNSGNFDWYDLCSVEQGQAQVPGDASLVARADRYLTLRGERAHDFRTIRNPAFPSLVRFEAIP